MTSPMTSPAPREPTAPSESVLAALAQLDADPKLEGKGLSAAFARSFPDLPAEGFALAATEAARVAVVLGVPGIAVTRPVSYWQFTSSPNRVLRVSKPRWSFIIF